MSDGVVVIVSDGTPPRNRRRSAQAPVEAEVIDLLESDEDHPAAAAAGPARAADDDECVILSEVAANRGRPAPSRRTTFNCLVCMDDTVRSLLSLTSRASCASL